MLSVLFWVAVGVAVAWYVPGADKAKGLVDGLVAKVKGLISR